MIYQFGVDQVWRAEEHDEEEAGLPEAPADDDDGGEELPDEEDD